MSIIGFDIGTTGCKVIAFHEDGNILAQSTKEYSILTPHPTWAEQDAEVVFHSAWQCLKAVVHDCQKNDPPVAMAISCQGEAIIPVDRNGCALRPAILGMDTRTTEQNLWLETTLGGKALFQRTGMPIHTINTLPKLLWLRQHEAECFQSADQFLLYEDFIIRKLTGKAVISHCLASRTQMYDLQAGQWASEWLNTCGIESSRLAQLAPARGGAVGYLKENLVSELGLEKPLMIACGGHDQACAALGSGVLDSGFAMVSTGTAEVVEVAMEQPALRDEIRDGGISIYKHSAPGLFVAMTLNHSGGLLFRWFRDVLCDKQRDEALTSGIDAYELILASAPEGPTHLFVLPHFAGSGTPWLDTESRGAILGLTFADNRSTIAKAILEGLTFELRINLDLVKRCGVPIETLHAVGGGAKSPLWLQLKADICQIPIAVPAVTEAACLGAALLAGTAAGIYPDLKSAVAQTVRIAKIIQPNPVHRERYEERFHTYSTIYPTLKDIRYI